MDPVFFILWSPHYNSTVAEYDMIEHVIANNYGVTQTHIKIEWLPGIQIFIMPLFTCKNYPA